MCASDPGLGKSSSQFSSARARPPGSTLTLALILLPLRSSHAASLKRVSVPFPLHPAPPSQVLLEPSSSPTTGLSKQRHPQSPLVAPMDPFAGPSTSTPQRGSSSKGSRGGGRGKDGPSSSGRGGGSKKTSSSTAQNGGDNAARGKRGPGRPRGRGRGRGRGRIASSSLGRDSLTSRRSESTTRGGTVDPRGSAARGTAAPGSPGAEEDGAGTVRAREGREDEEDEDEDPADEDEDEGLLENLGEEEMKWREEMERIRGQAMG